MRYARESFNPTSNNWPKLAGTASHMCYTGSFPQYINKAKLVGGVHSRSVSDFFKTLGNHNDSVFKEIKLVLLYDMLFYRGTLLLD